VQALLDGVREAQRFFGVPEATEPNVATVTAGVGA